MKLLLIIVAAILGFVFLSSLGKRQAEAKASADRRTRSQALFDQTRVFLSQVESAGAFPSLEAPSLHLQDGEFAIQHESGSALSGFKSRQVAVGNRGGFAGIGSYPASWEEKIDDQMTAFDKGNLYLTNIRVLFLSERRNLSIRWQNLLYLRADFTGFLIHTNNSEASVGFTTENGVLWTTLIGWMSSTEVQTPKLPAGTKSTLTPGDMSKTEQVAHVTVRTPD